MNIGQQILLLLSALGAINGLILSAWLFANKKSRDIFLGLLLMAISLRVLKSVLLYFNPQLPKIVLQIGLSACFLIGPALYQFLSKKVSKWHWGILLGIVVVGGILVPYQNYPETWNNIIVHLIYAQWAAYLVLAGFLVKKTDRLRVLVYAGNVLIFVAYALALFRVVKGIYISGGLTFSFVFYLTVVFYVSGDKTAKKKKAPLTNADTWVEKLEQVLHDKQLYKDANLKISDLAKHINIPPHVLSQLLNDNLGKSFSTYINEYRINEACKLIATDGRLTFEAIGYEVGFNSKSTFYAAFKKIKGDTPAGFKAGFGTDL